MSPPLSSDWGGESFPVFELFCGPFGKPLTVFGLSRISLCPFPSEEVVGPVRYEMAIAMVI